MLQGLVSTGSHVVMDAVLLGEDVSIQVEDLRSASGDVLRPMIVVRA